MIAEKLLVTMVLLTLGFSFMIKEKSTTESMPVALRKILRASGKPSRDLGAARPTARISAEKPQLRTKPIAKREEIPKQDIPVFEVEVKMLPFPSTSDVRGGMLRAEFIARFGEPDASATWLDKGTSYERLVYQTQERFTAVLIRDGRVVSSLRETPAR